MSDKVRNFKWNENRCEAAKKLSAGIETNEAIAKAAGINDRTLRRWKEDKEFMAYVDKLTLENEMATRAGMLRALYRGADLKAGNVKEDKSTHLDYMKVIGDVQGLKTQKIEHSGEVAISKIEITTSKREDAD